MKKLIKRFLLIFRPLIRRFANLYDIRLNYHCEPTGTHPLIIKNPEFSKRHNIPKSVIFNTRSGKIVVGENTVFGEDVMLLTGKHLNISEVKHNKALQDVPEDGRDIIIGDNCYIGSGAILIGKIEIGDYAVIGAGSVVTKDVPPRSFYAGIPAVLIKKFD